MRSSRRPNAKHMKAHAPEQRVKVHVRDVKNLEPFHKDDVDMKFNVKTAILVPSTTNTNEKITKKEYARRVEETRRYMANTYGGYTSVNATGGYTDNNGNVVKEPVTEVVAYTDKKGFQKNKAATSKFLDSKQKAWKQDSIGYEEDTNAKLYYYRGTKKPATTSPEVTT